MATFSSQFANNESRSPIAALDDTDLVFKDIVINVKETQTGNIMFGAGINADAALIGSVVTPPRLTENQPTQQYH